MACTLRPRLAAAAIALAMLASCAPLGETGRTAASAADIERAGVAFLGEPGITREAVTERLGPPHATFEGGRVASYLVLDERERGPMNVLSGTRRFACFAVVVQYAADGTVARHAVVRNGSPDCSRE